MHPCSGKPDRGCRESSSAYRSRICRAARQDRKGTDGPRSDVRFWSASRLTSWSRTEQRIELASSQLEGVGRLSLPTLPSLTESTGLLVATPLASTKRLWPRRKDRDRSVSTSSISYQILPYLPTGAGGERPSSGRRDRFESCTSISTFLFGYCLTQEVLSHWHSPL